MCCDGAVLGSRGSREVPVSFPPSTGGSAGTVIKEMFNNNRQHHNHASFNSAVLLCGRVRVPGDTFTAVGG